MMVELLLCVTVPVVLLNWMVLAVMLNWYHETFVLPSLAVRSHQEPPLDAAPLDFAPPQPRTVASGYGRRSQLTADEAMSRDLWSRLNGSY